MIPYSPKWVFKAWMGEVPDIGEHEMPTGSLRNTWSHVTRCIVSGPVSFDTVDTVGWTFLTQDESNELLDAYTDFVRSQLL